AGDLLDAARERLDRGDGVDDALPGGGAGGFESAARWHGAGGHQLAVFHRELAGDVDEIPRAAGGDVGAEGPGDGGENDVEGFEFVGDAHLQTSGRDCHPERSEGSGTK